MVFHVWQVYHKTTQIQQIEQIALILQQIPIPQQIQLQQVKAKPQLIQLLMIANSQVQLEELWLE
jgi:hypothetical protein